jgi:hypothetical protein
MTSPSNVPEEPGTALAVATETAARAPAVVETASVAAAAQARASVEARYLVAMRTPRSWDTVRLRILAACKRPGFAEGARYSKPVGGKSIVGPSIRFAEESLRAMGNAYVETMVVFDDEERRIVRVTVTDLESNLSYPHDITIEKTVERRSLRQGQEVLGRRQNTKGETVYIVRATEDDLLVKQAALVSKAIRTGALRLLPSDILEEAMELVPMTLLNEDAKDPASARKRVCDAFFSLGVEPTDLEEYLGHKIEGSTPAEISLLRTIHQALKDGETTWPEVLETKGKNGGFKKADRGTTALREKVGAAPAASVPPSPAAPPATTEVQSTMPFGNEE